MNTENHTKTAAYLRVSTLLGQTTETQLTAIQGFCEARGFELRPEHTYTDQGQSGAKARRPALDRLVRDARLGKFKVVVVVGLDRLGRNLKHLVVLLDELNSYGVQVVSLRENIDLTSPQGRMMMSMIGAFAEFERSLISNRIKESLAARKIQAEATGSDWRCGRKPLSPEVVNEVLALHGQGLSIRKIASALNGKVSKSSVERIINDQKAKSQNTQKSKASQKGQG